MKNNGKWFYVFEAVLAVMVVVLAFMLKEKKREDLNRISVIIQNSEDNQWTAFRYGLKMAAQDQGIEVVIANTSGSLTKTEEISLIRQEISYGADAVIVQPVPGIEMQKELNTIQKKVPVTLMESCTPQQDASAIPVVEPDHYALGKALAEELIKSYCGNLSGKTIGIITEKNQSEAVAKRKKGFTDALQHTGAQIIWNVSYFPEEDGENVLKDQPAADLVAALDDSSTTEAGKQAETNNLHGALVYGIGNSTDAVYGLDTRAIECLIVPDTFDMGYQSLTLTAQALTHFFPKKENKTVSYTIMHKQELFSEKNQEIIFTMSQ